MSRRIGIYSGTFDPVHQGHIAFALAALSACNLNEIVFLPEASPRAKNKVTELAQRSTWLKEALTPYPHLHQTTLSSSQFTIKETLPELYKIYGEAKFTLLIGSDIVPTLLHRWENLELLLKDAELAIGLRGDDSPERVHEIMHELEARYSLPIRYCLVRTDHAHVSSSQLNG